MLNLNKFQLQRNVNILRGMQRPNGLFSSTRNSKKGFLRDTIYQAIGLESTGNKSESVSAYHGIFDVLLKYEFKLDWSINKNPERNYHYLNQSFNTETLNEIPKYFRNKQNDVLGLFLFKVGDLENKGIKVIRNKDDKRILQKLVGYLKKTEYWDSKDNGMWKTEEEKHASSIGACVAGLNEIKNIVDVPRWMIRKGFNEMNKILPRESKSRGVDLSLLSLIYPFDIVYSDQRENILENVENELLREKGVIRFEGDDYFSFKGREAEFTVGLPWLAIIYKKLGKTNKYMYYARKTLNAMNKKGEFPELYYGNTNLHNRNVPFGWTHGLFLNMLERD